MAAFDELPRLAPHAPFLIAGLLIVFWIYMRVRLLRTRQALRSDGEEAPVASAWLARLAASPRTDGLLLVCAALLILAMAVLGLGAKG